MELKPCPLCGKEGEYFEGEPYEYPENVHCVDRHCGLEVIGGGTDWNALPRREDIQQARREAFEECARIVDPILLPSHPHLAIGQVCAEAIRTRLSELEKETT